MKFSLLKVATIATGMILGASAQAAVIDFEDVAVPANNTVIGTSQTSGGFTFANTAATSDQIEVYNGTGLCVGGCWNNGTNVLTVYNPDATPPFEMVMTRVGGGAFNLESFETAPLFDSIGTGFQNLNLTGMLAGGGSVSASLTYDNAPGGQVFAPNFFNVTSVQFTSDGFWPAIDNMRVSEVPLPAGFGLLLAALGGVGLFGRRRTA